MSTLIVENLKGPTTGSNANKIIVPSGQTLDASGGTLVPSSGQTIQEVYAVGTGGNVTTTSTSAVTTNLSVSITPKYANSKLKVTLLGGRNYNNSSGVQMDILLYRDGVNNSAHVRWTSVYNNSASSIHYGAWSCVEYVDANSTTSTTFEVYFKTSSGTSYFNQTGGSTDIQPWLIVEEIAA